MRRLKLLFLLLTPSLLPAAQIISGSITWTTFQGGNYEHKGMVNLQTADTSITGVLNMNMKSPYINTPFPGFVGSVVVDPSGSICGGGLSFSRLSFTDDCGFAFLSVIDGKFDIGTFLYSGGPVTVHMPFAMNFEVRSFIPNQPEQDFPFFGSGTADFVAHSVQDPSFKTALIGDSLVLNFAYVPEPTSAALVFLTLAAFAIASARRSTAQ